MGAGTLTLSVLDQSPIRTGGAPAQALAETIELARAAERLGYHRFWVAEHHNAEGLAGTAPEIMITRLAAETRRMRIGSGGVMLSHYSPLKVAELFRTIEALYPGRIDLGIGRAPGSDPRTAAALAAGPGKLGVEHFPQQIADLIDYLGEGAGAGPFAGVRAQPAGAALPELWLLGSSAESAAYAAHFGCAFSFAHFITERGGDEVMAAYRRHFRPSPRLAAPQGNIGVFLICADTAAEAERLAHSRDLWKLRLEQGRITTIPSPEEALAYPAEPWEQARMASYRRNQLVGTPEQVKAGLLALAARYNVEEIVAISITYDFAARLRSYQLLAEAFALEPSRAAAA